MSELARRKSVNGVPSLERCPVAATMQVIGGKWKPGILRALQLNGVLRFGELKRCLPAVTQKMLTQQLRELEADGLVWRKVYAEVPPRVEYGRTAAGESLDGVLGAMAAWGRGRMDVGVDG